MPRAAAARPAVSTVLAGFPHFKAFVTWLAGRGVTSFGQVTLELLDDYLRAIARRRPRPGRVVPAARRSPQALGLPRGAAAGHEAARAAALGRGGLARPAGPHPQ